LDVVQESAGLESRAHRVGSGRFDEDDGPCSCCRGGSVVAHQPEGRNVSSAGPWMPPQANTLVFARTTRLSGAYDSTSCAGRVARTAAPTSLRSGEPAAKHLRNISRGLNGWDEDYPVTGESGSRQNPLPVAHCNVDRQRIAIQFRHRALDTQWAGPPLPRDAPNGRATRILLSGPF
jgi:hypothetical protein